MSEKNVKFDENTKPPYHGKLKEPKRISETGDMWYCEGISDGPYTTKEMREFYKANIFTDGMLCTNEGIDGNYYKLKLIFYPNIQDAFLPDEYNPLINLEHRTAAASADINRLTEKREWNNAAGSLLQQLPNTDTDPVEGDEELLWFLHYGEPQWKSKDGETITFGRSVRQDTIQIGDYTTTFEFKKVDPRTYSHKGDGILRIKVNEDSTTLCVREMMVFQINGIQYELYPEINGPNRNLVQYCDSKKKIVFSTLSVNASLQTINITNRPIPEYDDIAHMKRRSASDLLGFMEDKITHTRVFSESNKDKRHILKVVENHISLDTILTTGNYWKLTNWETDTQTNIRFLTGGSVVSETNEVLGTWSIKKGGSFALYQDKHDWNTLYRKKIIHRICLEMIGSMKYNMYVLYDTINNTFYLQEELAYFQILDGKVSMADICGRKAYEAIRIVL